MEQHSRIQLIFFISIFIGVLTLATLILAPFLPTLAVAAVFAVLADPLHERIHMRLKHEVLSALATSLVALLVVVIPLSVIAGLLIEEAQQLRGALTSEGQDIVSTIVIPIERAIQVHVPGFQLDVEGVTGDVARWITSHIGTAFSGTAQLVLSLIVGSIAFFYFLKDGPHFIRTLVNLSPLDDRYDRTILDKLGNTIHSVIRGSLLIALIQGVLTSVGFLIFGLPNPILWGSIAAIAALVPGVGTAAVIFPAVLFLLLSGALGAAIGLALWGSFVVGLVDNILMPKLLGARARIHPLLILVSVLGGIAFFGPSGFLLGPLVLSLLYGLADIYTILFKKHIEFAAEQHDG